MAYIKIAISCLTNVSCIFVTFNFPAENASVQTRNEPSIK